MGNDRCWAAKTRGNDRRWAARVRGNDRRWAVRTVGSRWAGKKEGSALQMQEQERGWRRACRAFVEGSQRESCRPMSRLVLLERPVHSRGCFDRTSNFERSLVEVRGVRVDVGMVSPANLSCDAASVSEL